MAKELDFNRYEIRKDGVHVNKTKRYFVLNIDDDLAALKAFMYYAKCVETQKPQLSNEMMDAAIV